MYPGCWDILFGLVLVNTWTSCEGLNYSTVCSASVRNGTCPSGRTWNWWRDHIEADPNLQNLQTSHIP